MPYREGEPRIDIEHYFRLWDAARRQIEAHLGHRVRLEIEPGRFLVAQAGVLVAEVHALNRRPSRHFALVDAGFNDLVRPSFYGSHHEMTVVKARRHAERRAARLVRGGRPVVRGGRCVHAGGRRCGHEPLDADAGSGRLHRVS